MKWVLAPHDAGAVSRLAESAGIAPLVARLLIARGISSVDAVQAFLAGELSALSEPSVLSGMDRAVRRIRDAVSSREKIVIYGDYDVDGVTGSAVLYHVLSGCGADVTCYIPDRMTEGYGLNGAALGKIRSEGGRLVVTVDCGIGAINEASTARELGLDLIITDHHQPARMHADSGGAIAGDDLPDSVAILHPALLVQDVSHSIREQVAGLTGVGVAFKLGQAVLGVKPDDARLRPLLDLVTLGTIADMGKITGENRVFVKYGLEILSSDGVQQRPGIAALKQVAGLGGKRVTAGTVGFSLAPRINASGRLERADRAVRLLTTDDTAEALEIASELDSVNRERQEVEERIWGEAREQCSDFDAGKTGALVLASSSWHPGVVGIVAARIAEEFYRPAVLIALNNGIGKGSARSIPGFDLYAGLSTCSDLLIGFGGHKYAAGLTVAEDRIPLLRERLNAKVLETMGPHGFIRTLSIDAPVTFEELTQKFMQDIERMAPFGQGNPEPRLGSKGIEVASLRTVGNGSKHLKMRLKQQGGATFDAIAFGKGEKLGAALRPGTFIAAVFSPKFNTWNGTTNIELEIRDVKVER